MHDLTSALSAMSDEELRTLVDARPDAFTPTPPSFAALATRLTLPGSVARALRQLNAAELAALEALVDLGAELGSVHTGELRGLPLDVEGAVAKLRAMGLLVGPSDAVHVVPGALAALPAGWRVLDPVPEDLTEQVEALPAVQREVLEKLASSGGLGTTRAARPDADPRSPVAALIGAGLLVRVNENTVRLPRPVRDALRGITPRTHPLRPPSNGKPQQGQVDTTATAQGLDAVRRMRQLVVMLLEEPLALNKDGTVGVRALAAAAKNLGFDPAFTMALGESAGLIGRGEVGKVGKVGKVEETHSLAATREALTWLDSPLHLQWAVLLAGWVASPWRVDRVPELRLFDADMRAPDVRTARLAILRAAGERLRDTLLFQSPVLAAGISPALIDATVAEAHAVGALAEGHPSAPLAALLRAPEGDVEAETKRLVPAEVDGVIAQADMTILAPGPLPPEMARMIETVAELESPGLATVYRVTEASVRRALDTGHSARELVSWLERHTLGGLPQAISFLIEDVARHHGALRAGAVASYVRCEDAALLARAAAKVASLSVLAPTVAVSELTLPRLLSELRAAGFQPSAEDSSGATLNTKPEPALVRATPSSLPRTPVERDADRVLAALRGSAGGGDSSSAGAGEGDSDTIGVLRAAARSRRHVVLGYVDKNGRGSTMTVLPLSVAAGQADVVEPASGNVVRIPLHRVTGIALA